MEMELKEISRLAPAESRALLAQLLKKKAAKPQTAPLSFAQQRLWFLDQLDPGSSAYNIPAAVRLTGRLDAEALGGALDEIIRRHDSLRTSFIASEGQPVQVIAPHKPFKLAIIDLTNWSADECAAEVRRLIQAEAQRPFDLRRAPLVRASLVRAGELDHVLMLVMHHIVSDGWSIGVLIRELGILYSAFCQGRPSPLPPLPIQYADYAQWQRTWLEGEARTRELAFWTDEMNGAPPALELPVDHRRPAVIHGRGASLSHRLPAELTAKLKTLNLRQGATMFMTTLAAFNLLLARYCNQFDMIVGTPISGRTRIETEPLIGFFVNTQLVRTRLERSATFASLIDQTREKILDLQQHQDLPFEMLVEQLRPARQPGQTPFVQVTFAYQNFQAGELSLEGLRISPLSVGLASAKFDLAVAVAEAGDRLALGIDYNADLFEASTIERMARHFENLLRAAVNEPQRRVFELAMLDEPERQRLLSDCRGEKVSFDDNRCLPQMFEQQAARTPEATAVSFGGQRLSYRELDGQANQLARHLQRSGVGPESLVGVFAERSFEMVISLLATLKAGAAYVPLDPAYPAARLAYMLEDAGVRVLLTQSHLAGCLPAGPARVIAVDAEWPRINRHSDHALDVEADPDRLAYVIYTSGSTGRPKGVMISHRAISNHMQWLQRAFPLAETDRVLQKTPFSFDASVWEFYAPWMAGASLVLARPGGHQDAAYLADLIKAERVTTLQVVPSLLQLLLDEPGFASCDSLRRVFCGGEALSAELQKRFTARSAAALINLYGPTEATIDATFHLCERVEVERPAPIGKPIANLAAVVLGENMQLLPAGVAGELHISGVGLARGYIGKPEQTAEKFIPDPFGPVGSRLYRTGDLARLRADGRIEFLGRVDHQVKLRGFRIELGEIEAALAELPGIGRAAVIVREDRPGDARLVAYVVPAVEGEVSEDQLRSELKKRLPAHMVPTAYVILDTLPQTPNGKLDRRLLPVPDQQRGTPAGYIGPRNRLERVSTEVWQEVLRVQPVGIRENFFDLGGHSILAVRLISLLEKRTARRIPLSLLFQAPTVEELARAIAAGDGAASSTSLVTLNRGGSGQPFFCVHPVGGTVYAYAELARRLGDDQPFYAFQSRGLEAEALPHNSIEAMAEDYLEAMRAVQPVGPYALGGWSMGGIVAYEMARRLRESGEEVAALVLIDSLHPALMNASGDPDDSALLSAFARELGLSLENLRFANFANKELTRPDAAFGALLEKAVEIGLLPADTDAIRLERLFQVFKTNLHAALRYVPDFYAGAITLVRASRTRPTGSGEFMGWEQCAGAGVAPQVIAADHYTLLRPPAVGEVARVMAACLNPGQPASAQALQTLSRPASEP